MASTSASSSPPAGSAWALHAQGRCKAQAQGAAAARWDAPPAHAACAVQEEHVAHEPVVDAELLAEVLLGGAVC